MKLFLQNSNLYDHDTSTSQTDRQTDRRTDGRTTCHGNTALRVASRGKNQIEGLFKDFQGPYEGYIRRTKLNQTSTFISIYKHSKLPQRGRGEDPAENGFYAYLRSERSHLEHLFQYQLVRSRRFTKSNSSTFKDLQTQIQGLSRTMSVFKDFPGLDFQGPARAERACTIQRSSPDISEKSHHQIGSYSFKFTHVDDNYYLCQEVLRSIMFVGVFVSVFVC